MDTKAEPGSFMSIAREWRVVDGDTIHVPRLDLGHNVFIGCETSPVQIRFANIDAPETRGRSKEKGIESKNALISFLYGIEWLGIITKKKDNFGRWISDVYTPNGIYVNDWLVEKGFAKYRKY